MQVRSKIEQKLTGFQKYLNSIIDSMPSALIALDEQLYVTQSGSQRPSGTPLDDALNQPVFVASSRSSPRRRSAALPSSMWWKRSRK